MDVEKFGGFAPPVSNYFRMPNEWINISSEINNLAELKVVQYVLRHTWGFQEYDGKPKPITVEEFMHGKKRKDGSRIDHGTGLKSDRSVKDGIKAAIDHGYLISEVDETDKARIKKAYALKMLSTETRQVDVTPLTRQVVSTPQTGSIYPSEVQDLPPNQVESTPRSEKDTKERHLKKEREKDSVVPASAQELPTSSQPEPSSLSLSQKNVSSFSSSPEESPTKEAKPTSVDYALFDKLCRKKGYAADFRIPRDEKNNAAIKNLREQGATAEQVEFVFNDIWDDKDSFWQQHRGKPSTVASQFTTRVWKMTQPAQKRQSWTGSTNFTEERMGVAAQEGQPVEGTKPTQSQYRPKEDQTPVYQRLDTSKPARSKTNFIRPRQAQQG